METTAYHAKYFAHDLTRRCASDSVEKLAAVLADAQVDLNPHQIEAALFAFRNPFSRGAILADEVGLGKTIEAGLLISQKTVFSAAGGALFICLERNLTLEFIRAMAEKKPERVVCLDEGFAGNDQLKANAVQIFKTKGITSFKTV
jgi:SNF2 family DNA or RNA helicase